MKKTVEESVREFHEKYGHLISDSPTTGIPDNVKLLRRKLIEEEYFELLGALLSDDATEIADGIGDLVYVLVGTAISYGIPFDRIFSEIHNSNMTKTSVRAINGNKYGSENPKGPGFISPQIALILSEPDSLTELELRDN